MTELVDPSEIERIVGAKRHPISHIARYVTEEGRIYILHSRECKESGRDLRDCPYSVALDNGCHDSAWRGWRDQPVVVRCYSSLHSGPHLFPYGLPE